MYIPFDLLYQILNQSQYETDKVIFLVGNFS